MRKLLLSGPAALALVLLLAALSAWPAQATDIESVTLDKRVPVSDTMDAYLAQLTISDTTYGGAYAPDPQNSLFAVLVYNYENHGSTPQTGHLNIAFLDDNGTWYPAVDPGTLSPVGPGQTSYRSTLEIAFPKDRKLVGYKFVKGFQETDFSLPYYMPSGSPTATPTSQPSASTGGSATPTPALPAGAAVLMLIIAGTALAGRRLIRR